MVSRREDEASVIFSLRTLFARRGKFFQRSDRRSRADRVNKIKAQDPKARKGIQGNGVHAEKLRAQGLAGADWYRTND